VVDDAVPGSLVARLQQRQLSGRPLVFCLLGPTASGKTALALALHERLPCDIVSVDSAQVYRGMDIGTAKPDAATLAHAPHRLVDILDPAEPYSAARFRSDALGAIAEIAGAGRLPLLVGGTMLYFRALLYGLAALPAADPDIRADIEREAEVRGWAALHRELSSVDPATAARLKPGDRQRIQRALEVYRLTGKPLSRLHGERGDAAVAGVLAADFPGVPVLMGIAPEDRGVLHDRIAQRFGHMLEQGLVEEVRRLRERGDLRPGMPSMRSVGYRQVWEFLDGRLGGQELADRGIIATRQLAKRQLTWMRSWPGLNIVLTDKSGSRALAPDHYRGQTLVAVALDLLSSALE